ncbi:MAG: hypothetical protein IT434_09690 [Phycisphaerales bacterium]|jgi:hypothetical protein|nr:hypothetical protein [Phycisphaerales bacterium]
MNTSAAKLLTAAAALLIAGSSWGQPERRHERERDRAPNQPAQQDQLPPGEAPGLDQPPADREKLKEELTRRIEETKRTQAKLEQALARLNEGGDPAEVRRDTLPGRFRDRLRRGREDAPALDRPGDMQDDRPRGPQGPGPKGDRSLTPEDRERLLAFLDQHMPRIANRFRDATKENPQLAEGLLNRLAPKFRELQATEHSQPDLFKLRVEDVRAAMTLQEVARSWRPKLRDQNATDDDKRQAREAVSNAVAAQYDARVALREHELKVLEDRIADAKREIDDMGARRDQRIGEEIDRWMNDLSAREPKRDDR